MNWKWLFEQAHLFLVGMLTRPPGATVGVTAHLGGGNEREEEEMRLRGRIVEFTRRQLGDSYRLGAEVPKGQDSDEWDCSEVVEAAYHSVDLEMPDGSPNQYAHCRPVAEPKPGDLGFLWSDKWGRIGHVMVATGNGTVIHAVGGRGVVEDPDGRWSSHPRFRGWRRHPEFMRPLAERA